MKIKKITAEDTQSALRQVKEVLGDEAIILHVQERIQSGKKKFVEVTAALDEDYQQNRDFGNQLFTRPQVDPGGSVSRINRLLGNSVKPDDKEDLLFRPSRSGSLSGNEGQLQSSELDDVRTRLESLTKLLQNNGHPDFAPHLMDAYADLLSRGVERRIASLLVATIERRFSTKKGRKAIKNALVDAVERFISEFDLEEEQPDSGQKQRIIALVGPTGVGKTTCIAKLSAIDTIYNKLKVGLISTDTYRIGAIEQLRTYADITKLDLEVVYKPGEMTAAIEKFSDCDVVYVDTPGRSQKNSEALLELTKFLKHCPNLEINLALSLTSQLENLRDIVANYTILPIKSLICTKCDESENVGTVLSVIEQSQRPVTHVSNGQSVPEDITAVESRTLAHLIMGVTNK